MYETWVQLGLKVYLVYCSTCSLIFKVIVLEFAPRDVLETAWLHSLSCFEGVLREFPYYLQS